MKSSFRNLLATAFVASASLTWSAHGSAAGDLEKGALLAQTCVGCHGVHGMSTTYPAYKVPKIAGQHADYIVSALKSYKTGMRSHKTMRAQAASLSDQDMIDLAAYFAQAPGKY